MGMMKIADTRMRSRIVDLGPRMVLTLFDRAAIDDPGVGAPAVGYACSASPAVESSRTRSF